MYWKKEQILQKQKSVIIFFFLSRSNTLIFFSNSNLVFLNFGQGIDDKKAIENKRASKFALGQNSRLNLISTFRRSVSPSLGALELIAQPWNFQIALV